MSIGERGTEMAERVYVKPRIEKLGVKVGDDVAVIGVRDPAFRAELRAAGARTVREGTGLPLVFVQADDQAALRRVKSAARMIAPDGALWLVTPRGVRAVTEADALAAGKAAGLTDVKVVRFSDTHTAHKFVIPLAKRDRRYRKG